MIGLGTPGLPRCASFDRAVVENSGAVPPFGRGRCSPRSDWTGVALASDPEDIAALDRVRELCSGFRLPMRQPSRDGLSSGSDGVDSPCSTERRLLLGRAGMARGARCTSWPRRTNSPRSGSTRASVHRPITAIAAGSPFAWMPM